MDQQAFRSLISSTSGSTSSSAAGAGSSSSAGRSLGTLQKRAAPSEANPVPSYPADLRPRKLHGPKTPVGKGGRLEDRTADHRLEKTDENFDEASYAGSEARPNGRSGLAGVDTDLSAPTKGLDFALLAENKAKLAREGGAETADDDLEQAYESAQRSDSSQKENEASAKRSRDEIIEAIKKRRHKEGESTKDEDAGTKGLGKGFKPIGFKPIGAAATDLKEEKSANDGGYKWVNGKRMRKKKKASDVPQTSPAPNAPVDTSGKDTEKAPEQPTNIPKAAPSGGASTRPQKSWEGFRAVSPPNLAQRPSSPKTIPDTFSRTLVPLAAKTDEDADEDDDEDIFAGVGGWSGTAIDADEEHGDKSNKPADLVVAVETEGDTSENRHRSSSPSLPQDHENVLSPAPVSSSPSATSGAADPIMAPPQKQDLQPPTAFTEDASGEKFVGARTEQEAGASESAQHSDQNPVATVTQNAEAMEGSAHDPAQQEQLQGAEPSAVATEKERSELATKIVKKKSKWEDDSDDDADRRKKSKKKRRN